MHFQRKQSISDEIPIASFLKFPEKWKKYKKKFKKKYTDTEEVLRRQIFFKRYAYMEQHNKKYEKKLVLFKIMPTHLTDRTDEELDAYYADEEEVSFLDDCNSIGEEWEKFKKRTKKTFKSGSSEEISKHFFYAKVKEVRELEDEVRKFGLAVDKKEMDKLCDFTGVAKPDAMFVDVSKTRLSLKRPRSNIFQ